MQGNGKAEDTRLDQKKRKKKRGKRKANYGPGVQRVWLVDSHGLISVKTFHSHPGLSCCCVVIYLCASMVPIKLKPGP